MNKKDITEELVHLSITDLLQCINSNGVKNQFIESIGKNKYKNILNEIKSENIVSRSESSIISMREFHNWVKLVLISNTGSYFKKPIALLDIAVGRGGDLSKWNKSNVKYVFGFDSSEKSINNKDPHDQGALERLANFKGNKMKVHFEVGNAMKPSDNLLSNIDHFLDSNKLHGFEIVSCQFALHYFFKSEIDLIIVLTMISKYLKPGGFFIGTTIDGNVIKKLFKETTEKVYSTDLFRISRNFAKTPKTPFGNEYSFTIFDTKDKANYFNTMGISTEYLVNFKKLEEIAQTVGLVPVKLNFFEDYRSEGKKQFTEIKSNTISFETIYNTSKWKPKNGNYLSDEEKELNGLYSTFVFKKV